MLSEAGIPICSRAVTIERIEPRVQRCDLHTEHAGAFAIGLDLCDPRTYVRWQIVRARYRCRPERYLKRSDLQDDALDEVGVAFVACPVLVERRSEQRERFVVALFRGSDIPTKRSSAHGDNVSLRRLGPEPRKVGQG